MRTIIQKHSSSRFERDWFKPEKYGLGEREISFIKNNRTRLLENATAHEITVAEFLEENRVDFFVQFPVFCKKIHTTFWSDFFIPKGKIVLEVDGSSHNRLSTRHKDAYRDAFMQEQGLRVVRITNRDVESGEYKNLLADIVEHSRMKEKSHAPKTSEIHVPLEKLMRKNLAEISAALNDFSGDCICFVTRNRRIIKLMTDNLKEEHLCIKKFRT